MPKRRRILCFAFLLLAGSCVLLHFWLNSGPVRRSVLATFEQHYGGRVELDRVSVRLAGGLILRGLRLHETSDPNSQIVCEVSRIDLHGSLWNLFRGTFRPTSVTIRKPILRVEQEPSGAWVLSLPEISSPNTDALSAPIQVKDAQIQLTDNRGRRNQIAGVGLELTNDNGILTLIGGANDPVWGAWTIGGVIASDRMTVRLGTPSLRLKREMADWLGAENCLLWDTYRPEGEVAVSAHMMWQSGVRGNQSYQILIDPRNLRMRLPILDETLEDVTGRVEITPREIRIHSLAAAVANGQLIASGTVSQSEPRQVACSLDVRRLSMSRIVGEKLGSMIPDTDAITGKFSGHGGVDPTTWRGAFDGSVQRVTQSIPLRLSMADGRLELHEADWEWDGGRVRLSARLPLGGDKTLEGDVDVDGVAVDSVALLLSQDPGAVGGALSGELGFRVPIHQWKQSSAWEWDGPVRLRDAQFGAVRLDSLHGTVKCRGDELRLEGGSAILHDRRICGNLAVSLAVPRQVSASLELVPFDLQELFHDTAEESYAMHGRLSAGGKVSGTLSPVSLRLAGDGAVQDLTVGQHRLGNAAFRYEVAESGVRFDGIDFRALGGRIRGSGRWTWPADGEGTRNHGQPTARTEIRVVGSFEDLSVEELSRAGRIELPEVRGRVSGQVQVRVIVGSPGQIDAVHGSGHFVSKRLWIHGMEVVNAAADAQYFDRVVNATSWSATLPAGKIQGTARVDCSEAQPVLSAHVKADNLNLARLIDPSSAVEPTHVTGAVGGELAVQWDLAVRTATSVGFARIQSLAIEGLPTIENVAVRPLEVRDRQILLRNFDASLWGGTANGSAEIRWDERGGCVVDVGLARVERIDLARLAGRWGLPGGTPRARLSGNGKISVATGESRPSVSGTGDFMADSFVFAGLPITNMTGTIETVNLENSKRVGATAARDNRLAAQLPEPGVLIRINDARPASGNLQGTVLVKVGRPVTYDANLRFSGVDLATVAKSSFGSQHPVSGNLSGEMRLLGTGPGAEALRGEMWLRVDQGNLWRLPVLAVFVRESSRVLNRLLNLSFEQGPQTALARRVTLERGVLRFHEFWIAGDVGRLFGEGTVGLDGAIDLNIVGNFDTGLPKNMPLIGQLNDALNFLQKRLVQVHLTGTLADPVALPVPLQDLTKPAERFFRGVVTGTLFEDPRDSAPLRR